MKWYYEWRLRRVRATIAVLEEAIQPGLKEDYTAHSQLRVLRHVESSLLKRLARKDAELPSAPAAAAAKENAPDSADPTPAA